MISISISNNNDQANPGLAYKQPAKQMGWTHKGIENTDNCPQIMKT